jgi:hypothetical protein
VKDANDKLIEVGKVNRPNAFVTTVGLDNTFVSVNEDYWSDAVSKSIMFEFNKGAYSFLPMTIPTQPPFTGVDICVFGGLNKKTTCGEILEFDVTIQVPKLGKNVEKFTYFFHAVKVKMTNDYDLGYLGAPVYIPGQIPFTSQFIAHPVGQIVETFAQYNTENIQDKKI